ncbi:HAD family hydrolase [Clostridium sp.]|uniref:Cof-type HAD-IIB family hydrolase n=1 Tax=Clostridium sp. TaxID=1506 RepID=UPI002622AEC8|nr:HAD family hydrolase [Clostridium sp.]
MDKLKYRLVCVDLDGTLLKDDKTITKENIEIIKKATSKGVVVCVATGRILKFVDRVKDLLEIDTPVIASNGGVLFYKENKMKINPLSYNNILKIKKIANNYNVEIYLNTEDSIISEKLMPDDYSYKKVNKEVLDKYKVNIIENYSFEKLYKEDNKQAVKAICINKDNLEEVKRVRKALEDTGEFEISSAEDHYCEINLKGISKGKVVEDLAKELGINIEEVMCIGDGGNDIEMLKKAGIAVAMENGIPEVKEIAHYITSSNNESGVGKAIRELIFNDYKDT